jgi:hypothetical protein
MAIGKPKKLLAVGAILKIQNKNKILSADKKIFQKNKIENEING